VISSHWFFIKTTTVFVPPFASFPLWGGGDRACVSFAPSRVLPPAFILKYTVSLGYFTFCVFIPPVDPWCDGVDLAFPVFGSLGLLTNPPFGREPASYSLDSWLDVNSGPPLACLRFVRHPWISGTSLECFLSLRVVRPFARGYF